MDPHAVASVRPLLAILVSLLAVPPIVASDSRPNLREAWSLLAATAKAALVLSMLPAVLSGEQLVCKLWQISPGVELALRVDALGLVFAMVASTLWVLTSVYSIGYVRGAQERRQTRYFASFALCLAATIGIAFAANLLTFLVFFEMLTVATYPLVLHKETLSARRGAHVYLAYTLPAGLALLVAVGLTWSIAGTLSFVPGGFIERGMAADSTLALLFLLYVLGVGVKAGLMPLHAWLPAAMVAPTPVSALLHAVAVVKAGVFGVLRVTGFVFGPALLGDLGLGTVLAWVACATLLAASLLALAQDNLKRRLAYSTVGHLGYIVLGAALANVWSWSGAVLHLVFHATMKITLFFCAGAIYVRTHHESIRELDGIGRQMPVTMAAFAIASLGLAGVPGVNGFLSKWGLASGAIAAEQWWFAAALALSGVLNAAYFFPIVHAAFFRRSPAYPRFGEASPLLVVPLVVTALASLLLGIVPDLGLRVWTLALGTAARVTGGALP
ncbi:monovalent cation/H+ antiporter subunit D family protein [Candidatus Binatia bacterium]|nr:monovalent cation/H+ antiporter subunit D family protein [Candidatus Binatia bacterium]